MLRWCAIGLLAGLGWSALFSQLSYLDRPDLLEKVNTSLNHTYNFAFEDARDIQQELLRATPDHPAPFFLEALILYWEHFPLLPEDQASVRFLGLMEQCVQMAENLIEQEETYLEGIFFDLFGRAFPAMFWSDNGKSGKLVPDLRTMYKRTKEGFELKEDFVEFYFSTGLYNYYIEAYPEAHPVYKPLLSFMQKGDKKLGLQQLNHAINHAVYLKVEAILFMSLIQLKYEEDLQTAAIYARRLYQDYPRNTYYQGHLITILLHQDRYGEAEEVLRSMEGQEDPWSEMIRTLARAYVAEKQKHNDLTAGRAYQELLELADSFGPFADIYAAMAYMGLSRLHTEKGLNGEARRYERSASKRTSYPFILNEHPSAPR
jgi:tetratricopeptide (TPR) repeat protein